MGLAFLLLTALFFYFPVHAAILGRLVGTLAFAVLIVRVHQKWTASNRRKASDARESRSGRYAAIKRILLGRLTLFLLHSVFFAICGLSIYTGGMFPLWRGSLLVAKVGPPRLNRSR